MQFSGSWQAVCRCLIHRCFFIRTFAGSGTAKSHLRRHKREILPKKTDFFAFFYGNDLRFRGFVRILCASNFNFQRNIRMTANTLPGGNETILIVDDHETIWDFPIEALSGLGYSVLLAENGLDAVEIYESNPDQIDLVLLDMIMPKAGGHQTFLRLKAIDPEVKVLLSSGFVSENEVADLLNQGARGFLPKPHRLPVVLKEIRRVLDAGKENS